MKEYDPERYAQFLSSLEPEPGERGAGIRDVDSGAGTNGIKGSCVGADTMPGRGRRELAERLESFKRAAAAEGIPVIRLETECLLKVLIKLSNPGSILEIGTGTGYSAVMMELYSGAEIVTVENSPKRCNEAAANIESFGLSERIRVLNRDAGEVLKELNSVGTRFDFIFLDAAKGQYLGWLKDITGLMRKGSVLVADNVLQEMSVIESRYLVARRERSTHERMREFLYEIKHDGRLESAVLNAGDGVSVSVMI